MQLRNLGLITEIEKDKLEMYCRKLGNNAVPSFLLLQWGMELIRFATPNAIDREDMLQGLYSSFYRIRSCQSKVTQIMDLPMPFQYFHIMNMMLMLNLLLWAYALGCQDSYFAPVIYMFVQMMFQGIRELSTALSDPFGDDEVDFPVTEWMICVYARMYGVLEDSFDVTTYDLSKVQRFIDPETVKDTQMIDVYIDLDKSEDVGDCACFCSAPAKAENTKMNKGDDHIPRAQEENNEGNDTPLLRGNAKDAEEHSEYEEESD